MLKSRCAWWWALAGLALVLAVISPAFGRAQPIGSYRPDFPPPALSNGCWPLPGGVTFDFPYQVRSDGDDGTRRHLVLQYDLVDEQQVRADLDAAFAKADVGEVDITVTPLPGVADDSIVRGTAVIDLPATPPSDSDGESCSNPYSTKRFPADEEPAS